MISLLIANQVQAKIPMDPRKQTRHYYLPHDSSGSAPELTKKAKRTRKKKTPKVVTPIDTTKANNNNKKKKIKKYGFRSKQIMIDKVYSNLCTKYEKLGILARKDEVLRGEDTVRLHVKKFKALQRIEAALETLEHVPFMKIQRISLPLSMKNQFQKKGFLVYVQLQESWMAEAAQVVFRKFDEFRKCHVARVSESSATNDGESSESAGETSNLSESASSEKTSSEKEAVNLGQASESPSITPRSNNQARLDYESNQARLDYESNQARLDYESNQARFDYESHQARLDYESYQCSMLWNRSRYDTYDYPENSPNFGPESVPTFGPCLFKKLEQANANDRAMHCLDYDVSERSQLRQFRYRYPDSILGEDEAHLWELLPWAEESELWQCGV